MILRIVIEVAADGRAQLHCDQDRPWLLVDVLRKLAEQVTDEQARQEAQTARKDQVAAVIEEATAASVEAAARGQRILTAPGKGHR